MIAPMSDEERQSYLHTIHALENKLTGYENADEINTAWKEEKNAEIFRQNGIITQLQTQNGALRQQLFHVRIVTNQLSQFMEGEL